MSNTWSGHFKTAREQLCLNCYLFTEITHMMKGKKIYKDIVPVSAMVLKSFTGSKSQSCWNHGSNISNITSMLKHTGIQIFK